jgi:hypothetical protein
MEQIIDAIEYKAVSEPNSGNVTINDTVRVLNFHLGNRGDASNQPLLSCPVFASQSNQVYSSVVVLLFGLREQASFPSSAYRLASLLNRPVVLFPIAKDTIGLLSNLFDELKKGINPVVAPGAYADVFVFSNGEHQQKIIDISNLPQYVPSIKLHVLCEGAGVSDITGITKLLAPSAASSKKNWAELLNADF